MTDFDIFGQQLGAFRATLTIEALRTLANSLKLDALYLNCGTRSSGTAMSKYDQLNPRVSDTIPSYLYSSPLPKKQPFKYHSASTLFPPNSTQSPIMQELSPLITLKALREQLVGPVQMRVLFTPEKPPCLNIDELSQNTIIKPINFTPLERNDSEPSENSKIEQESQNLSQEQIQEDLPAFNVQALAEPVAPEVLGMPHLIVLPPPTPKTATTGTVCNCKKTRCLRMYCDCFRNNKTCQGCSCQDCHNNQEHQEERDNIMLTLLERNPQAFRPKVQSHKHSKGCNCRRSGCVKKYCECYQAGLTCGQLCKCQQCKNNKQRQPKRQRTGVRKDGGYVSWSRRRH